MLIGVMGAMQEEVELFNQSLGDINPVSVHNKTFYTGNIGSHQVISVFSGWGKVASAATAAVLISKFDVDMVVLAGLCGGVGKDIHIGDIIVADALIQHDLDASPIFPKYEIPLRGISRILVDQSLVGKAASASQSVVSRPELRRSLTTFGNANPKVTAGLVATGDQFISDAQTIHTLRSALPGLLGVEMEGAAVAQVCYEFGVPYLVIRVASDNADDAAPEKFQAFVTQLAGTYIRDIITSLLHNL
jgi:adenosylhomocysteine nucleosidase